MRIVQFDKDSVPAEYPENFKKTVLHGQIYIGEYSGSNVGIADYVGTWPVAIYRTDITGDELVALFDAVDPTIWTDVDNSDNAEAVKFREAIGRNANRRASLSHPLITSALSKMVLGGIATQEQIDVISLGVLDA